MSGSRSSARPVSGTSGGGTGAVLVLGSAVAWSLAGLFTRLIEADVGALLFWRGLSGAAFILVYVGGRERDGVVGALGRLGRPGWAAATVGTLATVAFIAALRRTEVANVVLIYASAPFVAALLAWLVLRELPGRSTMAASAVALAGIALIVGGSVASGGLDGDALALVMTIGMATMTVIARRHPAVPMVAAMALSSLQVAAIGAPMADTLMVSFADFGWLVLFGLVQAVGVTLYTEGARRAPAAQAALLSTFDVPLAPLWVLIVFAELPARLTVLGGALVAAAVLGHIATQRRAIIRSQRQESRP